MQRPGGLLARIRQRLQNVLDAKFPLVPAVESTRSPRWRSLVGTAAEGWALSHDVNLGLRLDLLKTLQLFAC